MNSKIDRYINSQSRNKLLIQTTQNEYVTYQNFGKKVSGEIRGFLSDRKFVLKSQAKIEDLMSLVVQNHEDYGDIIAINNVGILLEPELKIDLKQFLFKFSKSTPVFLKWEGEFENGKLYHLSKEKDSNASRLKIVGCSSYTPHIDSL